jgi:hypothetical protein
VALVRIRSTRAAKAVYWLAGKLSRIQTPRRTYRIVSIDPFVSEPAGRHWMSCQTSMKLLRLSLHLDPVHWDHWALVHDHCEPTPCPDCGGCECGWDDEDDDQDEEAA